MPNGTYWRVLLFAVAAMVSSQARGEEDPLRSPLWKSMKHRFLGSEADIRFDARVKVLMPAQAEDSLNVPVAVRVDGLSNIEEIVVFADLNPIPRIIEVFPKTPRVDFDFRFKVEQSSPVRAAVRTSDGVWHVGGAWISAAGGGCTAPSQGTGQKLWQDRLGEVAARQWPHPDGSSRLRMRVMHPMDTGLAAGIPVFHLETLSLRDADGNELALIKPYEPISENPVFSFDLAYRGPVQVIGRDIQGNPVQGWVRP